MAHELRAGEPILDGSRAKGADVWWLDSRYASSLRRSRWFRWLAWLSPSAWFQKSDDTRRR
jgi:hypothetical protein